MIRKTPWKVTGLLLRLRAQASLKEEFKERIARKEYLEVLGINSRDKPNFKGKDLQKAYLAQIKKYHSDQHGEAERAEFEEITKYITLAFEELKKDDPTLWRSYQGQDNLTLEDEVAQDLFSLRFAEVKHTLYQPGNEAKRIQFLQQLERRKQQTTSKAKATATQSSSYQSHQTYSDSGSGFRGLGMVACACLAVVPFLFYNSQSKAKVVDKSGKETTIHELAKDLTVKDYSEKEFDIIQRNTSKVVAKAEEKFLNSIMKKRPHMLDYPSGPDPDIFEQLTNFSIAPDIHLFEVEPKYFIEHDAFKDLLTANSVQGVNKYELTQVKPNSLLTLSLEAERALQNIYVRVDDVLWQVKNKGKYTPPSVFFKFHGFIMFQLREKPFSTLQSYRNSKYISLFDLYFDFYSPIFFKRSYYNMYLTGLQKDEPQRNARYFGNVHLNHRRMPSRYIERDQKVVIMRDPDWAYDQLGRLKNSEKVNRKTWEGFYQKYETSWKKYYPHQAPEQFNI